MAGPPRRSGAPISGTECVAFRLVGHVGEDEIDDVVVAAFHIELDDPDARVVPTGACFEIPVAKPERVEVAPELAQVLIGVDRELQGREARLAEGVLRANERVAVEGVPVLETEPDGYRSHKETRVLEAREGAPLWLRPM